MSAEQPRLYLVPIAFDEACAFVAEHHRHHKPPRGHKFSIAAAREDTREICAVVMVGRPVSRHLDDTWTLEVNRLATDGTPNACSFLYGAAWRAAKAQGYTKVITYILDTELGVSLRAAGWREVGSTPGKSWNVSSRPRVDKHPIQGKLRFEVGEALAIK